MGLQFKKSEAFVQFQDSHLLGSDKTRIGVEILWRIGFSLGWQDIRQSYRRSSLGQIWIAMGMGVTVVSIGTVFGLIFKVPMDTFLPYVAAGIIFWSLISGILNEGCLSFIAAENLIRQVPLPKLVHVIRVVWRNLLTSLHNLAIFPIVLIVTGNSVGMSILLFPVGIAVTLVGMSALAVVLGVLSARYRDVPPIVNSLLGVAFYVTPVIWQADLLGDGALAHLILGLNPLYHQMQILRLPLLGQFPTIENWALSMLAAGVLSLVAVLVYKRFEKRIPFWV